MFEAVPEKREVRLKIDATKLPAGVIGELRDLIRDFPGESPVYVDCMTSVGPKTLALGPQFRVQPANQAGQVGMADCDRTPGGRR